MNTIWNVPKSKNAGIWWYIRTYLVSLAGILGLGFLLAVSLIISAAIAAISGTSANAMMGELINFVASLAILFVLFGMLFKWFPDTHVDWQDVVPSAVATALLFSLGKFAIAWYVGTQGLESTVWRGSVNRDPVGLGLLLGANRPVWCGINACFRDHAPRQLKGAGSVKCNSTGA